MLVLMFLTLAAGVILGILTGLYLAFDRGVEASGYVLNGAGWGAITGLILGGYVAIMRIAWLSRPGGPLHAPLPLSMYEWMKMNVLAVCVPMLLAPLVGALLYSVWSAFKRGEFVLDLLLADAFGGAVLGLFAGVLISGVWRAWLSRPGGPLDPRHKPVWR